MSNRIDVNMEAVNLHTTNIGNAAGDLNSFSHSLNEDNRSTITANTKGKSSFAEFLNIMQSFGEALNNSADQIGSIAEGFAAIDQSAQSSFTA